MAKKFRAKLETGLSIVVDTYDTNDQIISANLPATEVGTTGVYVITENDDNAMWALFKNTDNEAVYESLGEAIVTHSEAIQQQVVLNKEELLAAIEKVGVGSGDVLVSHNTGGVDNLAYMYNGKGVDNAKVTAYLKSEFDTGIFDAKGRTFTNIFGRWVQPLRLDSDNTYIIVFEKPGLYGPDTAEITI